MNDTSNTFIQALCDPSIYPNIVSEISVIETHISWVLLTGDYAYKIKKPIKFSFVDFSTLEKRKFYCYEELRLNSRLAPKLYLDVIAITGSPQSPSFIKSGETIEYAVKMQQFSQRNLLSNLASQKQLLQNHINEMAEEIAEFHASIKCISDANLLGTPEDIFYWVADNFNQIIQYQDDENTHDIVKSIQSWSEDIGRKLYSTFQQRRDDGFVRECHGDMHLGNMVLIGTKVTIFDGIDFNEHLRWIDVMSEVAFVTMDLTDRGYMEYANRFINLYLQYSGDYEGLQVFKYYLVYRAIVRAKVAILRISQKNLSATESSNAQEEFRSYVQLANLYFEKKNISLIITYGLSGSGKSTYTEKILESIGAVRIRSDVERKRQHGYSFSDDTGSSINQGIYSQKASEQTYTRLFELAKTILSAGYSVIVDACFLQSTVRDRFRNLAQDQSVSFVILEFQAKENVLKQRIMSRSNDKNEPSEADLNVLSHQLKTYEPLDMNENVYAITVDTEKHIEIRELVKIIESKD
jgi:aminoglycoside phosphotransferase family enzyme/predicted kinase